jgi:hypothetical protein
VPRQPDVPLSLAFLVGAPRSGTTWLQRTLAAHPEIASSTETDLFSAYLGPWLSRWNAEMADFDRPEARLKGLSAILDEQQFVELLAVTARHVYVQVAARKPGARLVLDKTPAHSLLMSQIANVFPAARFIHIIRDGRDAAQSLKVASEGWGRSWAPSAIADAAEMWAQFVGAAQAAGGRLGDRYLELRYEDLSANPEPAIDRCLRFLGINDAAAMRLQCGPSDESDSLIWGGELLKRRGAPPPEPDGFVGKGGSGAWRERWTPRDREAFRIVAGQTLIELGYESSSGWTAAGRSARVAAAAGVWRRRIAEGVRRRATRLVGG